MKKQAYIQNHEIVKKHGIHTVYLGEGPLIGGSQANPHTIRSISFVFGKAEVEDTDLQRFSDAMPKVVGKSPLNIEVY